MVFLILHELDSKTECSTLYEFGFQSKNPICLFCTHYGLPLTGPFEVTPVQLYNI